MYANKDSLELSHDPISKVLIAREGVIGCDATNVTRDGCSLLLCELAWRNTRLRIMFAIIRHPL
jgi:hypothetical protein